jgi:O-methyltransferase
VNSIAEIPDAEFYRPNFSPWLCDKDFLGYYDLAFPRTIVSADRCFVIYSLLLQAAFIEGDIFECGVYKGGTAAMMAEILANVAPSKRLYLFDTFTGMPESDSEKDLHKKGDFSDTTLECVTDYVKHPESTVFRNGLIPDTFSGLESSKIAFAHVDVDLYRSVMDCTEFIYPRLSVGGFIVFDDYGTPGCPGARTAVDEFFNSQKCVPLCLHTGQAIAFKSN